MLLSTYRSSKIERTEVMAKRGAEGMKEEKTARGGLAGTLHFTGLHHIDFSSRNIRAELIAEPASTDSTESALQSEVN